MKMSKKVYIAGPYRGATKEEVEMNIEFAKGFGRWVARQGFIPVIPHANTALMDYTAPDLSDEFWLNATMELLKMCDMILMIPGWLNSTGCIAEYEYARDNDIKIIDVDDILLTRLGR